jgi:hypothetical protein
LSVYCHIGLMSIGQKTRGRPQTCYPKPQKMVYNRLRKFADLARPGGARENAASTFV